MRYWRRHWGSSEGSQKSYVSWRDLDSLRCTRTGRRPDFFRVRVVCLYTLVSLSAARAQVCSAYGQESTHSAALSCQLQLSSTHPATGSLPLCYVLC